MKVALIGIGGMGYCHYLAYKDVADAEVVAVCDVNVEMMKEKVGNDGVRMYASYDELLKNEEVDYVDICTPNYMHSVIAVDALNKGINVFCEKPDAVSVEEALKMQAAAEESGKHLMVMRNNRYRKTAKYLKQYIADGKMGEIYCGRCGWQRRRGIPGKGGWFTTKEQSGGGPLIDLGVHMIDLAIWLMGNPTPVAVSGCTYTKFADSDLSDSVNSSFGDKKADGIFDVEDLAMGFIKFDNGACLQIEFSWASNIAKESVFVELRGDKAGAEFRDGGLKIYTEEDGKLKDILPDVVDDNHIHSDNLAHFANVLLNGVEPDFTPVQGVNMIKILEAMYKSAETGMEVRL